jgi:HSP20 family molecular chaperone IbpA
MAIKKRSFFERLSGSQAGGDDYDSFDEDFIQTPARRVVPTQAGQILQPSASIQQYAPHIQQQAPNQSDAQFFNEDDEQSEGQLPVDVYQTASEIVIRTFIAGVRPDEMNVSIGRDMVTIEGSREERASVPETDYFHHELFWGSFSRTIMLPQEIDVENSSAGAKEGLLTIILPKLDKARQTKLRIKAG